MMTLALIGLLFAGADLQGQDKHPTETALIEARRFDEAIAALEKLALASDDYEVRLLLALAHAGGFVDSSSVNAPAVGTRHLVAAETFFKRAIELAPDADARNRVMLAAGEVYGERGLNLPKVYLELSRLADPSKRALDNEIRAATDIWDRVYKDQAITGAQAQSLLAEALQHLDAALKVDPDNVEGLVYKGLVLRLQAIRVETQAERQAALVREAEKLSARAKEIMEKNKKP